MIEDKALVLIERPKLFHEIVQTNISGSVRADPDVLGLSNVLWLPYMDLSIFNWPILAHEIRAHLDDCFSIMNNIPI